MSALDAENMDECYARKGFSFHKWRERGTEQGGGRVRGEQGEGGGEIGIEEGLIEREGEA
jgi:hypothetical protein